MSKRAWILFAIVSVLWGIPYLLIKVAENGHVPPLTLAWSRIVLGAAVLLTLAARAGVLKGLRGHWRWVVAYGIIEISIPFPMIALGEQRVASSLAAIIISAVPLIIALFALRVDREERATGRRLVGLVVGLAGVIVLVGIDVVGSGSELIGASFILLAAVGYAAGPMMLKLRLSSVDPRAMIGASLAIAAVVLTPAAILDAPTQMPTGSAIASVVVLGLVCTATAFVLMAMLIAEIGPGRASVITYINPIIAVALGVTILGERPSAEAVAGLLVILFGSWLSTDGRLPPGLVSMFARLRPAPRPADSAAEPTTGR